MATAQDISKRRISWVLLTSWIYKATESLNAACIMMAQMTC
jgi:hypothetical protein